MVVAGWLKSVWNERHRELGRGEGRQLRFGKRADWTVQLSRARFYVSLPDTRQPSRALTGPSSEIAFPGCKVLNCGWEWGRESLPSSLSHSVTILVSTRLVLKELSLPAVFETGARGGVEEEKRG